MHASTVPNHVAAALQTLADILADSQATITHRLRAACTILRFTSRTAAPAQAPPRIAAPKPPAPAITPAASAPISTAQCQRSAVSPSPLDSPRHSPVRDILFRAGAAPPALTHVRASPPFHKLHPP